MKVLLMGLVRAILLIGVALLVYFFFGFSRWGIGGAIAAVVVGAIVSFALTFLFMNRAQVEANQQFRRALNRRKDTTKVPAASRDAVQTRHKGADEDVEDAYQDARDQGEEAGMDAFPQRRIEHDADDVADR